MTPNYSCKKSNVLRHNHATIAVNGLPLQDNWMHYFCEFTGIFIKVIIFLY